MHWKLFCILIIILFLYFTIIDFYITNIFLDLYYSVTDGYAIYKMEMSNLMKCALTNCEAAEQTEVVATLSGQSVAMASEKCALFFSNFPEMSIMCADTYKKNYLDNMVSNSNVIFFAKAKI